MLWNDSCWNFSSCSFSQFPFPISCQEKILRKERGKKIKLWYSDYGGVDKALNRAKEVWMDAVACELMQSNYCFIIVFFSLFLSESRSGAPLGAVVTFRRPVFVLNTSSLKNKGNWVGRAQSRSHCAGTHWVWIWGQWCFSNF